MSNSSRAILMVLVSVPTCLALFSAAGQEKETANAVWNKDFTSLTAQFRGETIDCPNVVIDQAKAFPAPMEKPSIDVKESWPRFTMLARWSASTQGWPDEYRGSALGYVFMCACDADLMARLFPEMISEGKLTAPLQFSDRAMDPKDFRVFKALRGQEVKYEVLAKAGFGAADYTIKTKVRVGLSSDDRTIFYYDSPDYISDHLADREILFVAHDAGDRILVEVRATCVLSPRRAFRDTAMGRVRDANRYFVERLYALCGKPPTKGELDSYAELIKKKEPQLRELIERYEAKTPNAGAATTSRP